MAAAPGNGNITTADLVSGLTETELAEALAGTGVTVSNVSYTGANTAAGTFSATDAGVIGFGGGIVLSTGMVADVVGPNEADNITTEHGTAGDAGLDGVLPEPPLDPPTSTFDAAVLEFDFTPDADQVSFNYVFSSEEYLEFVGSPFNDVFAFFVNGTNCAVVGDNADPVSVNTINHNSHADLYRDNPFDPINTASPIDTEMDGLTTVLTCQATVNAGQTNHMKLAIADTADAEWDSNVFIQAGSFSTPPPPDDEICDNGLDDDGDDLIDAADPDCGQDPPPPPPSNDLTLSGMKYYDVNANGTYDEGTDAPIDGWLIDLSGDATLTEATAADGTYSFDVEPGNYEVSEQMPPGWMQTGPGGDGSHDIEVVADQPVTGLDFGNVCLGDGGAMTRGFWQSRNGEELFAAGDEDAVLAYLNTLSLKDRDGDDAVFESYGDKKDGLRSWIRRANAKNPANQLSAQLAAMELNVWFEKVDEDAMIHAEGADSANDAGFASIRDLLDEANEALGDESPDPQYLNLLQGLIADANENLTFVQGGPSDCVAPVWDETTSTYSVDSATAGTVT